MGTGDGVLSDQRQEPLDASREEVGYSFELPDHFADDVRSSLTHAWDQVTDTLPGLAEILVAACAVPGVRVDREGYLRETLAKKPLHVQDLAVERTPREAGVTLREIEKLARRQQGREARRTTVLSMAAGLPGGVAAAATIPADLAQFYAHLMRMIQMLTYLFGWRDACRIEEPILSEEGRRAYLLFLGVMAGEESADEMLRRMAGIRGKADVRQAMADDAEIERIELSLAQRMATRVSGQVVGKSVPIAGALISGRISYGGFSDMCTRLRKQLASVE